MYSHLRGYAPYLDRLEECVLVAATYGRDLEIIATVLRVSSNDTISLGSQLCIKICYYRNSYTSTSIVKHILYRCRDHSSDTLCKTFCINWPMFHKENETLLERTKVSLRACILEYAADTSHIRLYRRLLKAERKYDLKKLVIRDLSNLKAYHDVKGQSYCWSELLNEVIGYGTLEVVMHVLGMTLMHPWERSRSPMLYKKIGSPLLNRMVEEGYVDPRRLCVERRIDGYKIKAPRLDSLVPIVYMKLLERNNPDLLKLIYSNALRIPITTFEAFLYCNSAPMISTLRKVFKYRGDYREGMNEFVAMRYHYNSRKSYVIPSRLLRYYMPYYYIPDRSSLNSNHYVIASGEIVSRHKLRSLKGKIFLDSELADQLLANDDCSLFIELYCSGDHNNTWERYILDAVSFGAFDTVYSLIRLCEGLALTVVQHFGHDILARITIPHWSTPQSEQLLPYERFSKCITKLKDKYRLSFISEWIFRDSELTELYGLAVNAVHSSN